MFPSWYGVGGEEPTAISHANALAGLVEISSYADAVEHPHLTNRDFGVIVPGPVAAKGLPSLGIAPVAAAPIDRFFLVVHMPYLAAVVGAVAPRLLPMPGTWHPIPLPMASIQSEDDVLECVWNRVVTVAFVFLCVRLLIFNFWKIGWFCGGLPFADMWRRFFFFFFLLALVGRWRCCNKHAPMGFNARLIC